MGCVRVTEFVNPTHEALRALLQGVHTIAVIGLSPKPWRPSNNVARNLQRFGYRVIPVYPGAEEVLGERAYARLEDVPGPIDLVNVFRASEHVGGIVDACLAARLPALWLQDGVVDAQAALKAARAGMTVVMDRCIYRDYLSLVLAR
jgi:uncharacterized protein